jgi:hypothetical protein
MAALLPVTVGLSLPFGGGFLLNEWTHGAVSEAAGLGHHHAFDVGGYHCASHDDPAHAAMHRSHMHGEAPAPHDDCPGGSAMHGGA